MMDRFNPVPGAGEGRSSVLNTHAPYSANVTSPQGTRLEVKSPEELEPLVSS